MPNGLRELAGTDGVRVAIAQEPAGQPFKVYRVDGPLFSMQFRFKPDGCLYDAAEQAALDALIDPVAQRERLFQARYPQAAIARSHLAERGYWIHRPDPTVDRFTISNPPGTQGGHGGSAPSGSTTVIANLTHDGLIAQDQALPPPPH